MHNKPLVSSFAVSFKKATITEDTKEAKKEHRKSLKILTDKYFEDIASGKVEGIRNAKELVEVIKADLLLMGEATERKEELNALEEARITRITQTIDMDDPAIQSLVEKLMADFNDVNDGGDTSDEYVEVTVQSTLDAADEEREVEEDD